MTPQLYPFSKNRYFAHKRMRSADFVREQEHMEHKLAFLSRWDLGTGVALGLEAQRVDGDSILVSPGFAVDGYGRWLIVDEPAVCRVRTLRGFDGLRGETALLWLAYHEELTDPMFVSGDRGEMQEYAAARESYSFYLTDMRTLPGIAGEALLFSDVTLFEDPDLRIRQIIPKILPAHGTVQFRLVMECFCPGTLEIHLHYTPDLPGWQPAKPEDPLSISRSMQLEQGETTLILTGTLDTTAQAILLSLPEAGFMLEKRGVQLRAQCCFQEKFTIAAGDPLVLLEKRLLSQDPREILETGLENGVPIARVHLIRYGDQVLLDSVFPLPNGNRVTLPCLKELLRYCGSFFSAPPQKEETTSADLLPDSPAPGDNRRMATGVVTLNAGLHVQKAILSMESHINAFLLLDLNLEGADSFLSWW